MVMVVIPYTALCIIQGNTELAKLVDPVQYEAISMEQYAGKECYAP